MSTFICESLLEPVSLWFHLRHDSKQKPQKSEEQNGFFPPQNQPAQPNSNSYSLPSVVPSHYGPHGEAGAFLGQSEAQRCDAHIGDRESHGHVWGEVPGDPREGRVGWQQVLWLRLGRVPSSHCGELRQNHPWPIISARVIYFS